jgi:hypothetical protein
MQNSEVINAIAFAAVSHACLEDISTAFIINLDDIGFELRVGKNSKVYVPTVIKRELDEINQDIKSNSRY